MGQLPQIPGYRLLKVLKQSKRSRTFLAEQQSLARQVALKVLSEEFFDDPALRQRFVDEGKSAARLNHPHVLAVFDIGSAGGFPFIATEFVPGGTLRDRMQQPMAPVDALRIARDLASALDYAHSQGVIHRDIKPSNIMFRGDGAAVLGDLGILKAQSSSGSMQIGSPHYMSPEQIEGATGDGRADLYSLGIVLFEMLTGRPPFDADDPFAVVAKHLTEPVPRLPEAFSLYQPLIDRTLAKNADERFSGAREMVVAIDGYIEPKTIREPRSEAIRSAGRTAPRADAQQPADAQVLGAATVMQPSVSVSPAANRPRAERNNLPKAMLRIGLVLAVIAAVVWGILKLTSGGSSVPAGTTGSSSPQLGATQGMLEGELNAAKRLISTQKFFEPASDNAMAHLLKAEELDPSGQSVKQLRADLAQAVAAHVESLRKQGNSAQADALLNQALQGRLVQRDKPPQP
jgi:serine/threonine-protein kinase PpkA